MACSTRLTPFLARSAGVAEDEAMNSSDTQWAANAVAHMLARIRLALIAEYEARIRGLL